MAKNQNFVDFSQKSDFSHDFVAQKRPSENSARSNHFASHYIIIRLKPTVAPNSAPCLTRAIFHDQKKKTHHREKITKKL